MQPLTLKQFQSSHRDTKAFAVMLMEIMHHRMVLIQMFVQLMDLKPLSDISDMLVLQLCKSIHKHDISKITDRKQLMDFMSIYSSNPVVDSNSNTTIQIYSIKALNYSIVIIRASLAILKNIILIFSLTFVGYAKKSVPQRFSPKSFKGDKNARESEYLNLTQAGHFIAEKSDSV